MNDQLQQALSITITKAVSSLETATNFLAAEIPDVIHQLLMWKLIYSASMMALGIIGLIGLVALNLYASKFCIKKHEELSENKNYYDGFQVWFPFGLGSVLAWLFAGSFFAFRLNLEWLQIWVAPKVWLIEYAARMMK